MSPARRPGSVAPPAVPAGRRRGRAARGAADAPGGRAAAQRYVLRLYVTGASSISRRAIERVRSLCETRLRGRYELEVIDIYQRPRLAKDEQIVATPTLIRVLPAPLRRFIGDLSKADGVIFGMDLREKP